MIIRRLDPSDVRGAKRWDEFVFACPEATFFHRSAWQGIIKDIFRHHTYFFYAENEGGIQGVLPIAHVNSLLFGNALIALPFAVYGGIAASNAKATLALEEVVQELAKKLDVDHVEFRNVKPKHTDWPTQDLYVTFVRDIPQVLDEKMLCIPQKRRNMVRKAIKLGLYATHDATVDDFFPLYAENSRDHGTPALGKKYFQALRQAFGENCDVVTVRAADG